MTRARTRTGAGILAATVATAVLLSACTLHDPRGRPTPGENFNPGAGFGVSSQSRTTPDIASAPRLFTGSGSDDGQLTGGLTRVQHTALLSGCDMLFATQPDKRRSCKGGDYAFEQALQAGCAERHRDDAARRRHCLAPLTE